MPETIEAEVIEIDGVVPLRASKKGSEPEPSSASRWSRDGMRGTIVNLDRRWWPLWLVLGVLAVVLAATVGVVLGLCYLVFSLIRGFFRGLFGGGSASGGLRRG
jgi:hypothetical protein